MTNIDKRLIVIVGPTGSGKTDLSIRLARHFDAPVLSTDSRQIYRDLPVGTAQPSADQLAEAKHYFIATHDLTQTFSCGEFETQALELLEHLFTEGDTVIAVGGSGLYVKALCEGMDDFPPVDEELRRQLNTRLQEQGLEPLLEELRRRDPEYYSTVDRDNPSRVLRAVEVCMQTGMPYSSFRTGKRRERNFDIIKIGVDLPRDILYDRINRRVDQMLAQGLEEEARRVYPMRELNSLQTVGYRELFEYFDGTITFADAVELIKRNSRRYAKRQLTWFRRDESVEWFSPDDFDRITACIQQRTKHRSK